MRLILQHRGPRRGGRGYCWHLWSAAEIDGAKCPDCGGDRDIEATNLDQLPEGEPIYTKPGRETP